MKSFRLIFSLLALGAMAACSLPQVLADDASPPPSSPAAPAPLPVVEEVPSASPSRKKSSIGRIERRDVDIFRWGSGAVLPAGEEADNVVALFGDVRADGVARGNAVAVFGAVGVGETANVDNNVVAVLGDVRLDGKVQGNAVAISGAVSLGDTADADDNVVAVLGNVRVNGPVRGNVVSVLGGVELGPKARVEGDVVSVGAPIKADPEAEVRGNISEVAILGEKPELKGLQAWVRHALLLGRPLALHRDTLWAWGVAGLFLALYLFIALVMNGALLRCSETLEQRPGKTVLAAFLTVLLTPLLLIVLSVTVVGGPLLLLAMGIVSLIGKAAFLCWFGRRVTLALGWRHALPAVFIGGVMLMIVYLIPFVGFAVMKLTDALGLGMVVYTMILTGRREKKTPTPPAATPTSLTTAPAPRVSTGFGGATGAAVPAAGTSLGFAATPPPPAPVVVSELVPLTVPVMSESAAVQTDNSPASAPAGVSQQPPPVSGVLPKAVPIPPLLSSALPRAGFGRRLGALLIDAVLIFGAGPLFFNSPGPLVSIMAVYLVVLWGLKGTTIGGIICGLKIVRLDDRPLDWMTAVVRGLSGFLSVMACGLGFLWVLFDEEKQSWHDKVAGTVVVLAPKGMSLV